MKTALAVLLMMFLLPPAWEPWEGRGPGEHGVSEDGKSILWAGQVLDRRTGHPVEGCEVRVYSEMGRVVLDGDCTLVAEAVTDADGFVLLDLPPEPKPTIWVYEAAGYAPQTETIHDPPGEPGKAVVELSAGREFHGRVLDPLGRPCPQVRVSSYGGCRHAPAHRRTVTDAQGRFTLESVNVRQLWIEGPGIASAYGDWLTGVDGEALVLARPGVTATGRITNREGKALRGIWVRGEWSRGPGVRTDAEGVFLLPGLEAGGELSLSTDTLPEKNGIVTSIRAVDCVVTDPRPIFLQFDPGEVSLLWDESTPLVTLDLPGGAGFNRVALIHRETGETFVEEFEDGDGTMEVPAGPYEVRVGGPFCAQWLAPFEDEYSTSCPLLKPKPYLARDRARVHLELTGLPKRYVDGFEYPSLLLCDAEGHRIDVSEAVRKGEEILVPAGVLLALLVQSPSRRAALLPIAPVPPEIDAPVGRKVAWPKGMEVPVPEERDPERQSPRAPPNAGSVTVKLSYGDVRGIFGYLDGHAMLLDETAKTLSLAGVPLGSHRLRIRIADGSHWQREIVIGESEARVVEAP